MLERPKAEDYAIEAAKRGTGEIGTSYDYLQYTDPTAYYYEKLKAQNNPYLRADMWAEAAKRGESNTLLSTIMSQPGSKRKDEETSSEGTLVDNEYYQTWLDWEGYNDYDGYMLALAIPTLDDTEKIERTTTLEDGSEYSFGEYTDKEWATKIFEEQVVHWKAEKVEEDKKNKTFWDHLGDFCKTVFADIPLRTLGGIVDFVGDIWNLLEGVANIFVNWSGDDDAGDRFLYAFQNEDIFSEASKYIRKAAFELEYDTLLVNAVDAYKQGYRGWEGEVFDVGHTTVGQIVTGISQSIGYMLPSILIQFIPGVGQGITAATTAAKVGTVGAKVGAFVAKNVGRIVFYTGVFSGNIKNTVNTAKMNGISYQDLNSGKVVANAALKAVAQFAVEEALSWIIGASGLDRMFGQTHKGLLPKTGVSAPTSGLSSAGRVIAGGLKGAVKEGLEEFLQDSSDGLIDLVFGANGDTVFKQMSAETLNINNLLMSFVTGALTSMVMGTIGSAKFMWKRGYGLDADGKAYKLGFFQSIDYANSLRLMNEWNATLQDTNIKEDLRLDAAMKLATAYDTMSQIFKSIGEADTITVNKTLIAQAAVEDTKNSALMKMSAPDYADKLINDFIQNASIAQKKYITQKAEEAIKKAAELKEKGLKESLVTKFKQIFTKQSIIDKEITGVSDVTQEKVINILDKVKGMAIVAHDGTYVGFSDDVLFVPENMLDVVNEALEMAEYRDAVETVIPKLSQAQRKMLTRQFEKVTGTEGTLEDAVTALLFDKNFYCSILFLTAERKGYKPEAFQMLATIDQIIKNKLAPEMAKGNLREDIFMQIMSRVQENMRGGLINFTTKYAKVDLGEISNEVLSPEVKEVIRTNPNFLYTELIDKCLYSYKTITEVDRNRLVKIVENLTSINDAKKQDIINALDSGDAEKIADAGRAIEFLRRNYETDMSKIIYLPASTNEQMITTTITGIEEFIGITWNDLIQGNIDATKFTKEFADYTKSIGGVEWTNTAQRLRFLDNLLFNKSGHNLALDANGNILKVIDKHDFCKDRYATKNGLRNLKADIAEGKIKTIQDLSKLKLDQTIGKIKIRYTATSINGERAIYNAKSKTITFTSKAMRIDSIMHEITHIAQDILVVGDNVNRLSRELKSGKTTDVKSIGGTTTMFEALPKKTQDSIMNWFKKHSPIYYEVAKNANITPQELIYFTLDGELKARTTADVFVRECGFLYNKNETLLIAPDGTSWKIELPKGHKVMTNVFKSYIEQQQNRLNTVNKNISMFRGNVEAAKSELSKLQAGTPEYSKTEESIKGFQRIAEQLEAERATIEQTLGMREDAELRNTQLQELRDDPEIREYMKNSALKRKDGTPIVWYRGSDESTFDTMSSGNNVYILGEFYTTTYDEASLYGEERGYIMNFTSEELFVIDGKGDDFNLITDKLPDNLKAIGEKLYTRYKQFTDILKGHTDISVAEAHQIIKTELGENAKSWTNAVKHAMEKYNLTKIEAIKFIVSTAWLKPGMHPGIEALLPIAITLGKKAVYVKHIIDGSGMVVNELVPLKSGHQKRVTSPERELERDMYFDTDISDKKEPSRYISNKVARQSNLKYWIKKGQSIMIDPKVANFVIATTNDFDKLSPTIQRMIREATLTKDTLQKYIATAAHIDDFTFQAIAREFYNNEEVAKLTYKDMIRIFNDLPRLAAMSNFIEEGKNTVMSFDQIMQRYKELSEQVDKDIKLGKDYIKAINFTKKKKLTSTKGSYYIEVDDVDISQLNTLFFRLYDGTLNSLYQINNIGKEIMYHQPSGEVSLTNDDRAMISKSGQQKYENAWKTRAKYATIEYDIDNETNKSLDEIDTRDKIIAIRENYEQAFIKDMQQTAKEATPEAKAKILQEYKQGKINLLNQLKTATEDDINQMYLAALGVENNKVSEQLYTELIQRKGKLTEEQKALRPQRDTKATATNRGNKLAADLANRKANFDKLPEDLKQYFTRTSKGYVFNRPDYTKMSQTQVTNFSNQLADARQIFKEERVKIQQAIREAEQTKKRLERMARQTFNKKGETIEKSTDNKKTIREKISHQYRVKVHETNFSFSSNSEANKVVLQMLNTQFSKRAKSNVQGLISENQDQVVTSGKDFFTQNADIFLNSTITEIEDAAAWFLDSQLQVNATEDEFRIYQAVKQLFLGYVLSEAKADGAYSGFNNNLKQRIETELHKMAGTAGTVLSHQNEILKLIDPLRAMTMMDLELDGVKVNQELKSQLFDAIMSNDVEKINAAEQAIYDFIKAHQPKGQSFLRRLTSLRSMAMLSSPLTWLRNKVSNFMLKRIYKVSDAIGKRVFSNKHVMGQLKLDKQITPEIQTFINEHFIDNKLFDSFIGNLSKYNPSDITDRKNISEKVTKEQIMAHLVLKSMYSEYYNNETFKSPFMKKAHEFIMQRLSDNNYVRASAIRTFGKILAEKGYDLSENQVTDSIMNDFANAIGFAMAEYMHSDNFFHDIERIIGEKSEVGHFVYKLFLPYAASSWNWFKAMIKMSPFGLARSIIQMCRLEKNVAKSQANFAAGKTQITGELAEYMIRRDFGQGVIGTILWGVGIALAGLGFIKLDDDDYGNPKLRIGNIEVDISSVFGSSSLLAGAALIAQVQKNDIGWDGFLKGMNSMFDVWSDQLPIMDIVQMDMYSDGTFSLGLDQLGSILLSFIPNGVKYLAGGTYTGNLKKTTFLDRAMASIPFLGNLVPKKINPYTGRPEDEGIIGILNRLIPYFSYHAASQNQSKTTELGLNKQMLNGKYTINDKNFVVKGEALSNINKAYGEWNAEDLTKFYNNQLGVKVKVGNTYKVLKYNQMTGEQQKKAVQSLMSNNAELAKIVAWINAGNKYYASATTYNKLRKAGFTKGLYIGTKGFVSK